MCADEFEYPIAEEPERSNPPPRSLLGLYTWRKQQRARDIEQGFPADDEFTRTVKLRAGHSAFYLSMFLWTTLFVFQDMFGDSRTMLGVGILGQAGLYSLGLIYHRGTGVDNQDAN